MSDTSKQELIEEAAKAIQEARWVAVRNYDGSVSSKEADSETLARTALAVFEQACTPTDDELLDTYHDAVDLAMHRANMRDGFASNMSRESIVAGLRAVARFRRPKVPMPDWASDRSADFDIVTSRPLGPEPQGEPTDAQVEAAMREHDYSLDRETTRNVLRAAAEVRGEER